MPTATLDDIQDDQPKGGTATLDDIVEPRSVSQSEADIAQISRPGASPRRPTSPPSFDIGPSERSIAEGLVAEQGERRGFGKVPRQQEPRSTFFVNQSPISNIESTVPQAHRVAPGESPTPQVTLAKPNRFEEPEPVEQSVAGIKASDLPRASQLAGLVTDILTNPSPGAETGMNPLGPQVSSGLEHVATPGKRTLGALELGEAGVEAAQPLIGPAAIENPLGLAVGMGTGAIGSKAAEKMADAAGATPEQKELASQIGFFLPTLAGALFPKAPTRAGDVDILPPEAPKQITGEVAPPPPKPPSTPVDEAIGAMAQSQAAEGVATGRLAFQPNQPMPGANIGPQIQPDLLQGINAAIAAAPPEMQAQSKLEAHELLSKLLIQRGTVIGPDGKVVIVKSPDQAATLAAKWINDFAPEQPKPAKVSKKAAKAKPVTAGEAAAAAVAPAPAPANITDIEAQPEGDFGKIAPPEAIAQPGPQTIGTTEPESGRPVIQPTDNPEQLQQVAKADAPTLDDQLDQIVKDVPGATFERVRAEKNPSRLEEKIEKEDQPAQTVGDYLASQVVVDTPEGKQNVINALKERFPVVKLDDMFDQGDDKYGYRHVSLQVQMPHGETAEVQIVPKEIYDVNKDEHGYYKKGREAELKGDTAEFEKNAAEAKKLHDQAWQAWLVRTGQQPEQKETVPQGTQQTAHIDQIVKLGKSLPKPGEELPQPKPSAGFQKGDRVAWTGQDGKKVGTVAYVDPNMDIVRVKPDKGGTLEVSRARLHHAIAEEEKLSGGENLPQTGEKSPEDKPSLKIGDRVIAKVNSRELHGEITAANPSGFVVRTEDGQTRRLNKELVRSATTEETKAAGDGGTKQDLGPIVIKNLKGETVKKIEVPQEKPSAPAASTLPDNLKPPVRPEPSPSSAQPTRPPGPRWTGDRGAMPGEPSQFLDGDTAETAKAAIVERELDGKPGVVFDVVLPNGDVAGTWGDLETASKAAEHIVDSGSKIESSKEAKHEQPETNRPEPAAGRPVSNTPRTSGEGVAGQLAEAGSEAGKEESTGKPAGPENGKRGESAPSGRTSGPSAGPGERTGDERPAAVEHPERERRERKPRVATPPRNADWFTHPDDFSVAAGNSTRLSWNLKALELVKKALEGETKLTDEDRDALAHYVGWGALQWVFSPYQAPWGDQQKFRDANAKLRDLLSDQEFKAAQKTVMNAHYTAPEEARFTWALAKRLGFKGGTVLESSMGIGIFAGTMPKDLRAKSHFIGNELDPTTFNIAKLLYPSATLFNKDFVDLVLPDNSIDLSVGNVPFGEEIYDPHYPKLKARIHDYFIIKTLDKLRPGGVAALITSTGTLDKPSPRLREVMADKADLIFAIRFPAGTFEKTAGTHVITDLLVFQKREPGAKPGEEAFLKVVPVEAPHEQDGGMAKDYLNEYYDKHPENLLGKLMISRRMYGSNDLVLAPDKDKDFSEQLKEALSRVPKGAIEDFKSSPVFGPAETLQLAPDALTEGSYFLDDKGEIRQKHNGGTLLNPPALKDASPLIKDRFKKLIGLRDELNELLSLMRTVGNDDMGNRMVETQQKRLLASYKEYTKKHGLISSRNAKIFEDDPHFGRLLSLENYNKATKKATLADVFTKRTAFPPEKLTKLSNDTKEALYQVLNERGTPDLEFMAALSEKSVDELAEELGKENLIFRDPVSGKWEMRETYLSGYVKDKLQDAKIAVEQGAKEYQRNVEALEKVIPADIPIDKITVNPGATWIVADAIQDFLYDTLRSNSKVQYSGGEWKIFNHAQTAENVSRWGNEDFLGSELLQLSLNLKQPTVWEKYYEANSEGKQIEKRRIVPDATMAARDKQEKLASEFQRYFQSHKEWAPKLERVYNDTYNNLITPNYDGSHLTFPGMNTSILRGGRLMPHQVNAIWRLITEGRGLLAHVVGAGKTFEMIAAGMEMKRLGLIKKPLYAVPNHLVGQWQAAFQLLYPGVNILVPSKEDFQPENRKRMMARIATNNWDAVIMAHSQFNLMDISPERQMITLQKDLDELEETYHAAREAAQYSRDQSKKRTVKQLEKAKTKLESRIKELQNLKSDKTINFDDTGIDQLFVDEAHEYKNLLFYTKMSRVAGLSQGDAKKATRLKMKTDYLLDTHGNRGVVFATGTPVQNTMAEMYNMIRYVAPDVLQKAGIRFFDDWAANFGKIIVALELGADSQTYRTRSKFAEFNNLPELQMMFTRFADVKTTDDLPELKEVLPKLKNGKPTFIDIDNPEIEPIIKNLVRRAAAIRGEGVPVLDEHGKPVLEEYLDPKDNKVKQRPKLEYFSKPKPEEDNMLNVVDEGRKAALDMRLIDPGNKATYAKVKTASDLIYKIWKENTEKRSTQLVFIDRYRFLDHADKELFNLYKDLKARLAIMGIPVKEIAVIHDYDKEDDRLKLFEDVNAGNVRVLIGSTQKMGAGMNVQQKLVALHHLDLPWKPGELEQREGRIMRQGNENKEVEIFYHLTKKSFDAYMAQTLETKAKFIWQAVSGKDVGRTITDAASDAVLSYEEMKAISSGNPDVKKKMELETRLRKAEMQERQHYAEQRDREGRIEQEENQLGRLHAAREAMQLTQQAYEKALGEKGDQYSLDILGQKFDEHKAAHEWLEKQEGVPTYNFHFTLNGVPISARTFDDLNRPTMEYLLPFPELWKGGDSQHGWTYNISNSYRVANGRSMVSLVRGAEAVLRNLADKITQANIVAKDVEERIAGLKKLQKDAKAFDRSDINELHKELKEVNKRLGIDELAAVREQGVTMDQDNDITDENGEDVTFSMGFMPLPIETFEKFYKADVAPVLEKLGHGLVETADFIVHGLFPRANVPVLGGPRTEVVDKFMEMKGEREKLLGRMDLALHGWEKLFDHLPQREVVDFLDRYKTGRPQRTKELQDLADFIKRVDDGIYNTITAYKPSLNYKENHFRIFWKVIPGSQTSGGRFARFLSRRPLQGTKGFMKQATLKDVSEGLSKGGVPYTFNPIKLLKLGISDSLKYVTAQKLWEAIGPNGLDERKFLRKGTPMPEGYKELDDRLAKVYFMSQAEHLAIEGGRWVVKEHTARLLNRFLSRDLVRETAIGRGLMWLKNASTALELSLSPFHAVFETIEAAGSMVGVGTMRMWNQGVLRGDVGQLGKGLAQILTSPAAPYTLQRRGRQFQNYLASTVSAPLPPLPSNPIKRYFANRRELVKAADAQKFMKMYPAARDLLDDLFAGGAKLAMHEDYRLNTVKSMMEAWHQENYIGAGMRLAPAVLQGMMNPLFNVYIPRLKLGLWLEQYSQQLEERADDLAKGKTTRPELARQVWDTVEDRFGEINFDNLVWNRTFKSGMQFLLRSVTWKFGTARGVGGALSGQANKTFVEPLKLLRGGGAGKPPQPPAGKKGATPAPPPKPPFGQRAAEAARSAFTLDMRLAWLFGVAVTTAIIGILVTKSRTGQYPWDFIDKDESLPAEAAELLREFAHPRIGGEDERGKPFRVSTPTYFRDVEGFLDNPRRYAESSESGLFSRTMQAWENENFYGDYVFDPNEPTYKKVLHGLEYAVPRPISVSSYLQQKERGTETGKAALSFFGFAPAHRDLDFTPAEKMMMEKLKLQRPKRTPEEFQQSLERRREFERGELPLKEMRQMMKRQREDWRVRNFKQLTYSDALEVFEKGNSEEQALWYQPLREKRQNLLRRNRARVMEAESQVQQ